MASHGGSGIAVGGSKHRRQASRENFALAEASLGGGAQRGSQSWELIEEIAGHQGGGSSSASHKKDDGVPTTREPKHNSHSPDWLREKFPLYDHYSPNPRGFAIIVSLIIFIFSTLCGLAYCIDQYFLPGFRILPIGAFAPRSSPPVSITPSTSCAHAFADAITFVPHSLPQARALPLCPAVCALAR